MEQTANNVIFIGAKNIMNYVNAAQMQFRESNNKEIVISARGRFISRAVDVEEILRKRFLKDENLQVKEVKLDSEEFEDKENKKKKVNVSSIEIRLEKI